MLEEYGKAEPLKSYIGMVLNVDVSEGYLRDISGAKEIRVTLIDPLTAYTLEYVPGRINVVIDKNNEILKFFKG